MVRILVLKKDINSWYATWRSSIVCLEFLWRYQCVEMVFGESKAKTFAIIKHTFTVQILYLLKASFSQLKSPITNSTMPYSSILIYNKANRSSSLTMSPIRFQGFLIWWITFRKSTMKWKEHRNLKVNFMMWRLEIHKARNILMNKMKSKTIIQNQKLKRFITKNKSSQKLHSIIKYPA